MQQVSKATVQNWKRLNDDGKGRLTKRANILIPQLDTVSVKSAAALLNATLYRYYYVLKFPDIKILKSNLQALPLPQLSAAEDLLLASLTDQALSTGYTPQLQERLDQVVYGLFGITPSEQEHIHHHISKL